MLVDGTHAWPTMLAAFLASFVEAVEALTVVLAVGVARGWRSALTGSALGLGLLLGLVLLLGPALTRVPLDVLQAVIGTLLLLFGLRWLRKAILRSAGLIALHDEAAAFDRELTSLRGRGRADRVWDRVGMATAFQIVMLEGIEVVFIVVAIGAGGVGLLLPASVGALAALAAVVLLGLIVHRPLASVPENTLKFVVGILLSAFGTFWAGEGFGVVWPGGDWSLSGLVAGFAATAALMVPLARSGRSATRGRGGGVNGLIRAIARELWALFVDDGLFAAAILVWLGVVALIARLASGQSWVGALLFVGLAGLLVVSIRRRARQ